MVQRKRGKERLASHSVLVPTAALGWLLGKGSVFQTVFAVKSRGLVAASARSQPSRDMMARLERLFCSHETQVSYKGLEVLESVRNERCMGNMSIDLKTGQKRQWKETAWKANPTQVTTAEHPSPCCKELSLSHRAYVRLSFHAVGLFSSFFTDSGDNAPCPPQRTLFSSFCHTPPLHYALQVLLWLPVHVLQMPVL